MADGDKMDLSSSKCRAKAGKKVIVKMGILKLMCIQKKERKKTAYVSPFHQPDDILVGHGG